MSIPYVFRAEVDIWPEVHVDEKKWTEKEIKEFNDTFYDADTVEDIARCALRGVLNLGKSSFIEGFGYIKVNGTFPAISKESNQCKSIEITNLDISWDVN